MASPEIWRIYRELFGDLGEMIIRTEARDFVAGAGTHPDDVYAAVLRDLRRFKVFANLKVLGALRAPCADCTACSGTGRVPFAAGVDVLCHECMGAEFGTTFVL